jgi:putative ABC transport system substrate-binding protein
MKAGSRQPSAKPGVKSMLRTCVVCLLTTALLSNVRSAQAQQPAKVPRIGFLATIGDPKAPGHQVTAFQHGLLELGHIEGKNILVEYRHIEGDTRRNPTLVRELVQLKVDALVLLGQPAIRAAKEATKTIPIVMVTTQSPVAAGFIESLARPGGNITGVTTLLRELSGKRLEVFKEAVPGLVRVAALMNATHGLTILNGMRLRRAP